MDADELELYARLSAAVGVERIVCPKVRAIDVIEIIDPTIHFDDAFRLNLKCISFLICDSRDGRAVCAIEAERLATGSNQRQIGFLKIALKSAELPIFEISFSAMPSVETLRVTLAIAIEKVEKSAIAITHLPHQSISAPAMASDLSRRSSV